MYTGTSRYVDWMIGPFPTPKGQQSLVGGRQAFNFGVDLGHSQLCWDVCRRTAHTRVLSRFLWRQDVEVIITFM